MKHRFENRFTDRWFKEWLDWHSSNDPEIHSAWFRRRGRGRFEFLNHQPSISSRLLAVWVAVLLLAGNGCAFLQPAESESHYYLLTAVHLPGVSAPRGGPTCVVRLLPVEVADYLKTEDMAVRTGTNEIIFAQFHRWAEPLAAGVRRALADDLCGSSRIREVLTDQPAPGRGPLETVFVRVLACEGEERGGRGAIVFEASWEISGPGEASWAHGLFQAQPAAWHPGDYNQLANRLSRAVDDLSRVLSDAIASPSKGASDANHRH
jgi:uncharacterized lipoprotein YmbA